VEEAALSLRLVSSPRDTIVAVLRSQPLCTGSASGVEVKLLRRFSVTLGDRCIGHLPRPSARALFQILLVSPGRRISGLSACQALFCSLSQRLPHDSSTGSSRWHDRL
jgi:hypothetical protein